MQLPAGVPLGAFLSFRDLRSVHTSRLVADTSLPQLIAGIPRGRLALRDARGRLPLHWAADRGQTAAAEALLTLGADPDARDEDGSTPLHYAGMCGHKETFEALIRLGADPEAKDNDGEVPVLEADA